MDDQEIRDLPIPTATPYTLPLREDRTGPDARGYQRSEECGCLMTQVCYAFGLPIDAQDNHKFRYRTVDEMRELARKEDTPFTAAELQHKLALFDKLQPYGAPNDWRLFWNLVIEVQSHQDDAWNTLINWMEEPSPDEDHYFTPEGDWIPAQGIPDRVEAWRRGQYELALKALRCLGVEVKWIEGLLNVDKERDFTWLRKVPGYCPIGGAV